MTLIIDSGYTDGGYTPGKLTMRKSFVPESYMWEFPALYPIWTPANITTALWLDAADNTTVFSDAGTTQAIAGLSTVQQWNDKSGNSRHVSQATSNFRPAYSSSTINGRNALTFITDDSLSRTSPGLPTGASSRSMLAVYKPNTTGLNANGIAGQAYSGTVTNSWFLLMHRNDAAKGDPYFATYAGDITDNATPTLTAKIGGVTYDGTTARLYKNGAEIANGARTLVTDSNVLFFVGKDGSASPMNGAVAEIVFTANALSTNDRQKLEGYLAHKWGLTADLPSGHPYKTVGPTP